MCDYSLNHVKSRAAKVGDKLITKNFGRGTTGFADVNDLETAVCVLPGTEIAFDTNVQQSWLARLFAPKIGDVAIFRQINKTNGHTHHDALEFVGGKLTLLTSIAEGRKARVLQMPAAPKNNKERQEQQRVEVIA